MPTIYINLSNATDTAPAPWSYNFFSTGTSVTQLSSSLLDSTNTPTGVALDITTAFSTQGYGASVATADAGDFLEEVLDGHWRSANGSASTLQFSGLPSGASYTLQAAGHNGNAGRDTKFTVEGVSSDYILGTAGAPTAPVSFSGTVDPDGIIVVDTELAATGAFYGYVNGFILDYTAAPSYTIDSIDGDNDVQAGQPNVDIVMTATTGVTVSTLGGETLTINGVS